MIVLDTHTWIWWVDGNSQLSQTHREIMRQNENTSSSIGICAISCWEVAKLVEIGRLSLAISVSDWLTQALALPGVRLLELTPRVAVESTQLPPPFHRDPSDQIIVATARVFDCQLLTIDQKILAYPHVRAL